MSAPGDGQDVSLLAFSFYDATPEARAATLERLRAAWEANTVLALGELVHVAALRADPTVASSWASGSLDEALEGLVERPYSMEPVVLRGTAEAATSTELDAETCNALLAEGHYLSQRARRDAAAMRSLAPEVRAAHVGAGAYDAPSTDVPRHLRLALRSATQAFDRGDFSALGTANPDLQPLIDAAIARLRHVERERDEALQRLSEARAPVGDVDPEEVLRLDREATPGPWTIHERPFWIMAPDAEFGEEGRIVVADAEPTDATLIITYRTAAPKLAREVIRLREVVRFVDEQGAEAIDRVSREIVADKWKATGEFQRRALAAEDKLTRLQVVVLEHAASLAKREHLPSDDRADWVECYGPELTWEVVRAEIERTQRALTAAARRLAEAADSKATS